MQAVKDLLHRRSSSHADKDKVCVPRNHGEDLPNFTPTPRSNDVMVPNSASAPSIATANPPLVVVELFQSQGCSSCPPANDNVIPLADDTDKLILTYEVTYWDYLGWSDTFGNKDWDARQRDYSYAFKNKSVYTPQVCLRLKRGTWS